MSNSEIKLEATILKNMSKEIEKEYPYIIFNPKHLFNGFKNWIQIESYAINGVLSVLLIYHFDRMSSSDIGIYIHSEDLSIYTGEHFELADPNMLNKIAKYLEKVSELAV